MTTKISTTRVQQLRDRRKKLGLIRVEFYLTKLHAEKVKNFVFELIKGKK